MMPFLNDYKDQSVLQQNIIFISYYLLTRISV
jgi:hypothetical protein